MRVAKAVGQALRRASGGRSGRHDLAVQAPSLRQQQQCLADAALPRQRLDQLRALYMTHERVLVSVAVDRAARSRAFESSEFLSAHEEKRAA